ncbi:hypothetical protein J2X61_000151 [Bacillus sp. 3255]|nr:hypothetical protein [Bacillus sp. 3255]
MANGTSVVSGDLTSEVPFSFRRLFFFAQAKLYFHRVSQAVIAAYFGKLFGLKRNI